MHRFRHGAVHFVPCRHPRLTSFWPRHYRDSQGVSGQSLGERRLRHLYQHFPCQCSTVPIMELGVLLYGTRIELSLILEVASTRGV